MQHQAAHSQAHTADDAPFLRACPAAGIKGSFVTYRKILNTFHACEDYKEGVLPLAGGAAQEQAQEPVAAAAVARWVPLVGAVQGCCGGCLVLGAAVVSPQSAS
jgi:hypothetical protein